jgi:Xaa-Pro aminopeptidase
MLLHQSVIGVGETIMQRSLAPIIAGCVAALVFAAPKPASAMTAPAIHYGETDAGIVQPVKKKGYNRGRGHKYGHYKGRGHKYGHYRNYGHRRYGGYGYRPYGYYGDGYPYRRQGLTLQFDF